MPWPNYVLTKTVTGTYTNSSGTAAKGRVTFTPTSRILVDNELVLSTDTLTASLDTSGSFSIDLPTTDNPRLTPNDWAYLVNVRLYGVKPSKYYIKIPYGDGTSVDISNSLLPSTPLEDVATQTSIIRGPSGPAGNSVLSGSGAPSNSLGKDGDLYIDGDTGAYYGPKVSLEWPSTPFYSPSLLVQREIFTQPIASSTWNITHALGGRPSVTVVDSAGTVVIGEVVYNSDTSVTVLFSAPFSGYAYLT